MSFFSIKKGLEILQKNNVPENIINHSMKVNQVAVYIAEKLHNAGEQVNISIVNDASLLHDIDKHLSLKGKKHGEEAPRMLREAGMERIIPIVSKHFLHTILESGEKGLNSWEEKIVYYADKRVVHDNIVSLDERFAYLKQRYGQSNPSFVEMLENCKPKLKALEEEIFSKINESTELASLKD